MRSLTFVLAAVLVFSLVACGDDDGGVTTNNNNNHQLVPDAALQPDAAQPQPDAAQPQPDASQPQPDAAQPGNGVTGDPCGIAGQCGGITNGTPECLTTLLYAINFTGGYCSSQSCTVGSPCDNGAGTCVSLGGFAQACLKACTVATECRQSEGYDCTTIPYVGGEETYCLPGGGMSLDGGFGFGDGGFGLGDGGLPFP